jgi:hypothetical protein
MLAAGLGQVDSVHALLDAGADRNRSTGRYKMMALYLAAEQGNWQCTQILLGGGPSPDQLRVEISLATQRAEVWKDGVSILTTICSTGRQGYQPALVITSLRTRSVTTAPPSTKWICLISCG